MLPSPTSLPPQDGQTGKETPHHSTPTTNGLPPPPRRPRVTPPPAPATPSTQAHQACLSTSLASPADSPDSDTSYATTGTYTTPDSPDSQDPRSLLPGHPSTATHPLVDTSIPHSIFDHATPDSPLPQPSAPLPASSSPTPTPTTSHLTAPSDLPHNEEVMDLTSDVDDDDDIYDEEMSTPNQHSSRNMYDSLTGKHSTTPQALDPSAAKSKRPRSPQATTDAPTPSNRKKGEKKPAHSTARADYVKTPPNPTLPPTATSATPRSKPPTPQLSNPLPPPTLPADSPVQPNEALGDGFIDPSKKKRGPGAGRPVGTGGPNKAMVMAANAAMSTQLASAEQENARLRQLLTQLQPSSSSSSPSSTVTTAPPALQPTSIPPNPSTLPLPAPPPNPPQQPAPTSTSTSPPRASNPPKHHQHLRHSEKARPSRRLLDNIQLSPYSPKDIVVTFDLPAGAQLGNHSLTRTPKHTGKDLKVVFAMASFLQRGMLIPPPTLTQATNRHQDAKDLHSELHSKWMALAKAAALKNTPPSSPTLPPLQAAFLDRLLSWDGDSEAELGDILLNPPPSAPYVSDTLSQWEDFLGPTSNIMQRPNSTCTRVVLHLSFPSTLARIAAETHLSRYQAYLASTSSSPSSTPKDWFRSATRSRILPTPMFIEPYRLRLVTTKVTGWSRGPDHEWHTTPEGLRVSDSQPLGSTTLFLAYLLAKAPNCTPQILPLTSHRVSVVFVHEERYKYQLYALNKDTSPTHELTVAPVLQYGEQKKAGAQVCSKCGTPGHLAITAQATPPPMTPPPPPLPTRRTRRPWTPQTYQIPLTRVFPTSSTSTPPLPSRAPAATATRGSTPQETAAPSISAPTTTARYAV